MRRHHATAIVLFVLLTFAGAALAGADDHQADRAERQKLVGVWKGFVVDGTGERPDRGPVQMELTITEETMHGLEIKPEGNVDHGDGTYAFDLAAEPRHLDATQLLENKRERTFLGIYTLEGDTLKWCVSPRRQRPQTFETMKGAYLLILKRAADRQ